MGIFSWLTGGAGKAIADGAEGIGNGVSSIATGIRAAITGPEADPTRLAEIAAEAERLQVEAAKLQTEVNTKKFALDRAVRDLNWLNRDYPPQTAAATDAGAKPQ